MCRGGHEEPLLRSVVGQYGRERQCRRRHRHPPYETVRLVRVPISGLRAPCSGSPAGHMAQQGTEGYAVTAGLHDRPGLHRPQKQGKPSETKGHTLRVTHIITGTDTGGAEMALYRLLEATDQDLFRSNVISLDSVGPVGRRIQQLGIPVSALYLRNPTRVLPGLLHLFELLKRQQPHIVQTWMYHADLLGGLAARAAGVPTVVWGLRKGDVSGSEDIKLRTALVTAICARSSRTVPTAVVTCSEAIRRVEAERGYDPDRMRVIPNGVDIPEFPPGYRSYARARLGIPQGSTVIGRVARFHPHKDYETTVAAAARVINKYPQVRFLFCGTGVTEANTGLASLLEQAEISDRVHLLGRQDDVNLVHAACDISCSTSSHGEGFPNVVAEAMAAGLPVVATDDGDSSLLVDGAGMTVPRSNPIAVGDALMELISAGEDQRREIGEHGRRRIAEHYTKEQMAQRYAELYVRLSS